MSDGTGEAPVASLRGLARSAWHTMLTVYYANSVSWRLLKSGALVFLGLFSWAGSSILLSYRPGWTVLHYTQAYGFVLVGYGPFHHLVVIPVYQRLRREGHSLSLGGSLHVPNASLILFVTVVVVLGTFPMGPMTIDFASQLEGSGVDVDPALLCVKGTGANGTEVHCHLSESDRIDHVVVRSGGTTLAVDREPPFDFTVRAANVSTSAGAKRFTVDLVAADGSLIRRYTRSIDRIPAE
ncbi:MAG: hypothetical protein ABEJ35_04885 [Halobacteriaceae archaeon]